MSLPLLSPFLAFLVSFLLLQALLRHDIAQAVLDQPNERSLHQHPVPRIGGIALMAGVGVGWIAVGGPNAWLLLAFVGALVSVSVLDDWRGLPIAWRFITHTLVAVAYLFVAVSGDVGILVLFVLCIGIIWMINLYNFMDGSDGLAGGMTLIGFGCYGFAAWLGGDHEMLLLNLCVATATAGFLLFNFHPAKVFLGDGGSIPLGFLAATMGLIGWERGVWPSWFPLLVFSPFIVDATVTLLKRFVRGEKIWRAHRDHYYQRLILLGHGHRKTALLEYALMIAAGLSALWGTLQSAMTQVLLLGAWALIYLALAHAVDRRWRNAKK